MPRVKASKLPPVVWISALTLTLICFGGLFAAYSWRISTFDRTIATVMAVRTEVRQGRGGPAYFTMGELAFVRVDKQGRSFHCRHEFEIGKPADGYIPGDRIVIIPVASTCQRVDVLGRPEQP